MNYKEALTKTVQHREVFKKQTGGRGKFADIIFEIGPAEEGKIGLTFVDEVKGLSLIHICCSVSASDGSVAQIQSAEAIFSISAPETFFVSNS